MSQAGFPGCALKILDEYPLYFKSVEGQGNKNGEFFYEFDVVIKNKENQGEFKEVEIKCNPITLQSTDIEEEVKVNDYRFKKLVKIPLKEAEVATINIISGIIVDREYAIENNKPVYEFDILNKKTKKEVEVEVDGFSGEVIEEEIEFFETGVGS